MTTATVYTSKDASALSASFWSGFDLHAPCGFGAGSNLWRPLFYFPVSFTGWTAITSAILTVIYSDATHAGYAPSGTTTVHAYRMTSDWGEGVNNGENLWTSGQTWSWANRAGAYTTTGGGVSGSTSQQASGVGLNIDITAIAQAWLAGSANYGVILVNSTENSVGKSLEFWDRSKGSAFRAYVTFTYSTNTPPNAPTNLSPTGSQVVNTLTPAFFGVASDPDAGDTMGGYQIQVYKADGVTLVWDSGTISASSGGRIANQLAQAYLGPALTGNTTYAWQARTYDAAGAWGPYSAQQGFRVNSLPSAPTVAITGSASDERTLTPTILITHNDPDPGDGLMYAYHALFYNSNGTLLWDTGNTSVTPTATYSLLYAGPALQWQGSYYVVVQTEDSNGAWGTLSAQFPFSTHTTSVPTNLAPSGGAVSSGLTPVFTGSRGSSSDSLVSVSINVYDATGTVLIWASGTVTSGVTTSGFSIVYGGSTLAFATTYTWQVRTTGSIGGTSQYSGLAAFNTPVATAVTQSAPVGSPITTLTPSVTWSRTTSFNYYDLIFYEADGVTVHWASTPTSMTSGTSKTITYAGTALQWNTQYFWQVRVSSDGGVTWGSGWSGLVSFTTDAAGLPTLTGPTDGAWLTTTTPTFTGTTASAESATAYEIVVYAADGVTLIWDSGSISQAGSTSFSKVYSGGTALTGGSQYFWQARYTKASGAPGNYSSLFMFHINAPPTQPSVLLPVTGSVAQDTLRPTFTVTFSDPDLTLYGDYPTKLEIEVYRQSDNTLFGAFNTTSGLIAGANSLQYPSSGVTALVYETVYIWHARYTDSKGAAGGWSSYQTIKPSQSSTVVITSPISTVTSPRTPIQWLYTSPGGKPQHLYQIQITRNDNSTLVYDSGLVTAAVLVHTVPAGFLINSHNYTFVVTVYDTDGI